MRRRVICFLGVTFLAAALTAGLPAAEEPTPDPNDLVKGYSTQKIVCLNPGEEHTFRLRNGAPRAIKLVSVREYRDSVINLMRRADVQVEIDGRPLDLVCAPYVMPTEIAGLRIQADTTRGWLPNLPRQVQFSLWDATDPIVDTTRFGFPLRDYRLFSHSMQAFNEPLHNCAGDADPAGNKGYHNYGFDLGAYGGAQEVLSAVDGTIAIVARDGVPWVGVIDAQGYRWGHAHLYPQTFSPDMAVGAPIKRGQKIACVSFDINLHLGRHGSRRLNLYPWLVTAYQAAHPKPLLAVARPYLMALTGEKVTFDGSNSLTFDGGKIVQWRWELPNGQRVNQIRAEKVFDRPGVYFAALWVRDDKGNQDVDFCQIKVFTKAKVEDRMPHLLFFHIPSEAVRVDQPVRVRCSFVAANLPAPPLTVEFDDGRRLDNYRSGSEITHRFKTPGVHIVTAFCQYDGKPITGKMKVVVEPQTGR